VKPSKDASTETLEFLYEKMENKQQTFNQPSNQLTVGNSVFGKPQNCITPAGLCLEDNSLGLRLTVGNSLFGKKQGEI
jgi:hypothetical protein